MAQCTFTRHKISCKCSGHCCTKVWAQTANFVARIGKNVLVKVRGSLKCVLSQEAESMAVTLCELHALADKPMLSGQVQEAMETLAQHKISRHAVLNFLKRNASKLTNQTGKMLSPSSVTANIVEQTERFTEQWSELVERKRIHSFDMVMFDKTVIDDTVNLGKAIDTRDRRTARVCRVREKQLCV